MYSKKSKKNKPKIAFVSFFNFTDGGHGAAEVSKGFYESLNNKTFIKKYFQFNEKKVFNKSYYLLGILKIFYVIKVSISIVIFLKSAKKKIIFVEGASWIGFTFILYCIVKSLNKKILFIYHAHNIEYQIRKKNIFIIQKISFFLESFIYKFSDFATVVSANDKKEIKKLYKTDSIVLENGISKKQLKIYKKKILNKKYYLYSGSYLYHPNKVAIDELVNKIHPQILKLDSKLNLVITGNGLPKSIYTKKNIIYIPFLKREKFNSLIKYSEFLLFPLRKAPGTKLKVIDGLVLGKQVISTKYGISGINALNKKQPYKYTNLHQLIEFLKFYKKNKLKIKLFNKKISVKYKKKYLIENLIINFFKKINY